MKTRDMGAVILLAVGGACLSGPAAGQQAGLRADTTLAVAADARLDVRVEEGSVRVVGWERDQLRATARSGQRIRLDVEREGGSIRVRPRGASEDGDDDPAVDLEMRVPRSVALRVHGPDVDIRVEGVDGAIEARNQDGNILIVGGGDTGRLVSVRSGDGDLEIRELRGRIEAFTMDGDARLTGVEGDVEVESVDGDLILRAMRASLVTARTTDGDVEFEGELRTDGRYRVSTHDGDVRFAMAGDAGAELEVTVFEGELVTDLGARLEGGIRESGAHREYSLTVGGGGARVSLESFDGTVRITRVDGG